MPTPCCFICAGIFTQVEVINITPCGHIYHHDCLYNWVKTNPTCPTCRSICFSYHPTRIFMDFASDDDLASALESSEETTKKLLEQIDNSQCQRQSVLAALNYKLLKMEIEKKEKTAEHLKTKQTLQKREQENANLVNVNQKALHDQKQEFDRKLKDMMNKHSAKIQQLKNEQRNMQKKMSANIPSTRPINSNSNHPKPAPINNRDKENKNTRNVHYHTGQKQNTSVTSKQSKSVPKPVTKSGTKSATKNGSKPVPKPAPKSAPKLPSKPATNSAPKSASNFIQRNARN